MTKSPVSPVAPDAGGEAPVHGCVRCGAPVAIDVALCEECNPLGLAQPAASQVHGTALLGVIIAVVILAVVARLAAAGVGPFEGQVAEVRGAPRGLTVTLVVANRGTSAGATTCRVSDPAAPFGGPSAYVQSPLIAAGATVTFDAQVGQLGTEPRLLAAECSAP